MTVMRSDVPAALYPVKPATMFAGIPKEGKTARDHLDEWREEEKDYWVMNKTPHGIVRVTSEALSDLFFGGNSVVGLQYDSSRDTYMFIVEAPGLESKEGQELPTIDTILTSSLDEYEVHLVRKNTTEE